LPPLGKRCSLDDFDLEPIRSYLDTLGYDIDPRTLVDVPEQRPSTLCYLVVDERLLMLRRRKEPFSNLWTAPGGKLEPGETPLEAIVREVWEETGLKVSGLSLRAICSERGGEAYDWLLFVFRATACEGEVKASDEGELRWLPIAELDQWPLPDVDRKIMRYVLDDQGPYFLRVVYTPDHLVGEFEVRPLAEGVR